MESLETATAVIDRLGGTTATARLTGRKPQHVTNWRASGRLPADTFLIMRQALEGRQATAPVGLWGIKEPAAETPLRALVSELRPLIDERLDIDERISEIRGPASDKGLDFSQAKSLVIALARDSRDGGERVAKLTAKADNASWYADMLKSPTMAETSNNSPQSPADKSSPPQSVASPSPRSQSDGAAVSNRPAAPSDTPTNSGRVQPLEMGGSCICEFSPDTDVCVHCGVTRTEWCPRTTAASNSEIEGAVGSGPHLNGRIESDRKTDFTAPSSLPDDGDVRGSPFDRNRVEA